MIFIAGDGRDQRDREGKICLGCKELKPEAVSVCFFKKVTEKEEILRVEVCSVVT